MTTIFDGIGGGVFNTLVIASNQRESTARYALQQGMRLYEDGKYEAAIRLFRQSVSISPQSENAPKTFNLIAGAYLKLEKPDEAVKAYRESLQRDRYNLDTRTQLAKVLFVQENYTEAVKEYDQIVRFNSSAPNRYSLGQALLKSGRFEEAEQQFKQVVRMAPTSYSGFYGMGLVMAKTERKEESIEQFQQALRLNPKFNEAKVELGYVYADLNRKDEVDAIIRELKDTDPVSSLALQQYAKRVAPPRILYQNKPLSTFITALGPKTPLFALDAYLANAGASKELTVVLQFSKPMDKLSVENVTNWRITRSDKFINGLYNNGLPPSDREVQINPLPYSVTYNSYDQQATIKFTLTQNAASDATVDPKHLIFKFMGVDENGIAMDPKADEFSGYTGPI